MNFSNWFGSSDKATDPLQRIERALSSVSTSIMIADENRTIVFANRAVLKMLSYRETDIRKELPNFNANTIVGSSIDVFHKNPAHQAGILSRLTETYEGNIKIGGLRFRLVTNPILAEDNTYLGSVVEWHDRTTEIAMEQNLARILGALESATTNVMIADNERNIFYMNKSVEKMFRETESELRKQLPHFSVDKLIGSNMDIFHKNPAHQMQLLASLSQTFTSQIKVGDLHFRLVCNPIFDAQGERIATVVEWVDRTQEVRIEEEINAVVLAAGAGDFKPRISTENKKDFFLKLAEGLNNLLTITNSGLNDINRVMTAIADGDLTVRVEEEYEGSFDDLKDACNQTAEKLAMMLNDIQVATETINTASNEISKGNTDLSSRTEQQASSLEETASSMEELTSTVRQNADNAKQANILATKSTEIAEEGGRLINSVVKTMSSINESSEKIADIIGVIDGIAFQTNILAINAKVEAARAGEQGRGFAVVASEVGTLAQRSANAAKEIKALISDSVSNVNQGNELVNKSGETMKDIVTSIKHVNDIMAEIAAASAEQSAGLDEVGKAVLQMDEMTQQNAALVEQAAAAAESLLSQSEQLARNVTQFKVAEGQATQPSARFLEANNNYSTQKSTSTRKVALPTKNMIKPARPDDDEWEAF